MDIKEIYPEDKVGCQIANSYRLNDSELPQIIAGLASTKDITLALRSRGIVIRGRFTLQREEMPSSSGIRDNGMLVYNPRLPNQEGLYLVTFIPDENTTNHPDLVDILRHYIC